jgi:hypothetical protein
MIFDKIANSYYLFAQGPVKVHVATINMDQLPGSVT